MWQHHIDGYESQGSSAGAQAAGVSPQGAQRPQITVPAGFLRALDTRQRRCVQKTRQSSLPGASACVNPPPSPDFRHTCIVGTVCVGGGAQPLKGGEGRARFLIIPNYEST